VPGAPINMRAVAVLALVSDTSSVKIIGKITAPHYVITVEGVAAYQSFLVFRHGIGGIIPAQII